MITVIKIVKFTTYAGPSMQNPLYCYAKDKIRPQVNMASLLTSYEAVRRYHFTNLNPYVSTCTPSRFWYLGMYGTRLPLAHVLQDIFDFTASPVQNVIIDNYAAGRTSLCREDYENIRNFTMNSEFGNLFRMENEALVTEAGIVALQNIAKRYQQLFPNILSKSYTQSQYYFRHIDAHSSNDSIRAFATGLFGDVEAKKVVYESIPVTDWLLRPLSFCPAFQTETADWESYRIAFREGPEVREMIEQVNTKLGFHTSNQLDFDQLWTMWNMCVFTVASTFETSNSPIGSGSPWCAPFSHNHYQLFEYHEDLRWFYYSGYGVRNRRLLENLSCGMMKDLLLHMKSENKNDKKARIFMTNAHQIHLMMVALGTFKDLWPMHQHNFAQQTERNWLISLISPFSGNLAVVRYDCGNNSDADLIFLLNERPILVPGCDRQTGACKLSFIMSRFQLYLNANCPTYFCSSN